MVANYEVESTYCSARGGYSLRHAVDDATLAGIQCFLV